MNPDEKAKWVAALRSGQYKQCRTSQLYDGKGGYCCLGVALVAIEGIQPNTSYGFLPYGKFGLSQKLQEALALSNDINEYKALEEYFDLILEDYKKLGFDTMPAIDPNTGMSDFNQIADWIEANL